MTPSRPILAAAFIAICAAGVRAGESGLVEAPPLAGRASEHGIELSVLPAGRPLRSRLFLRRDDAGAAAPETEVRFAAPAAFARPFPCVRIEGAPAAAAPPGTPAPADTAAAAAAAAAADPLLPADTACELVLRGLDEGAAYRWRLVLEEGGAHARSGAAVAREEYGGRFVTVRPRGAPFTFAVFSDSHVFPSALEPTLPPDVSADDRFLNYVLDGIVWYRTTRERVAFECARALQSIGAEHPDFAVSLGDVFDLHGRGFNWAFDSPGVAAAAHREARRAVCRLGEAGAFYGVVGNWEGESGSHPQPQREFAIDARQRYMPNPRPDTSPLGGGPGEDYFAWRWGDVLCVALDVRGYTPTPHELGNAGSAEGKPDDFTLGPEQKAFLEKTLRGSDLPYKVTFIHHTVGGNAGDAENSAYGRGGGRAAHVGEQAWVHDLCVATGVQVFFYGHDHVFTDMVVDGMHYALPGTTSAPWRFTKKETGYDTSFPDSGYARVKVSPQEMRVEFVTLEGNVLPISFSVPPRKK